MKLQFYNRITNDIVHTPRYSNYIVTDNDINVYRLYTDEDGCLKFEVCPNISWRVLE